MFNTISWQGYWTTIALLLVPYYLVVCLVNFRKELSQWFRTKKKFQDFSIQGQYRPLSEKDFSSRETEMKSFQNSGEVSSEFSSPPESTDEHLVYSFMDEISAFFSQAIKSKWTKEDLLQSLKTLVKKYPSLKQSVYKESITNVLITESRHNCSVTLNEEDMVHVWLG